MNDIEKLQSLGLARAEAQAKKSSLGQEDFLKLMITQLNHQDPFKPMENGEFLGQIAQFSAVSGIKDLQDSFSQLASSLTSSQALQASSLVGRDVLVGSEVGALGSDGGVRGAVDLPVSTSRLTLGVYDANGELVRRLELGSNQPGLVAFNWDGLRDDGTRAVAGRYELRAEVQQSDGTSFGADTMVAAAVDSVTLGGAGRGLTLNLAGLGEVNFQAVREIM